MKTIDIVNNFNGSPDSKEWEYILDNMLFSYDDYLRLMSYTGRMRKHDVDWLFNLYDDVRGRKTITCKTCPGVVRKRLRYLIKSWENHKINKYENGNVFTDNILPLLKNFKKRYDGR